LFEVPAADLATGPDQRGDCRHSRDSGRLHHGAAQVALGQTGFSRGRSIAAAGQPAAAKLRLAGDSGSGRHAQSGIEGAGSDHSPNHDAVQPERRADGPGANRFPTGGVADRERHAWHFAKL
nr:hypothetical protein [Tanacetum cinerariifolium]